MWKWAGGIMHSFGGGERGVVAQLISPCRLRAPHTQCPSCGHYPGKEADAGWKLGQRRRRWPSFHPASDQHLAPAITDESRADLLLDHPASLTIQSCRCRCSHRRQIPHLNTFTVYLAPHLNNSIKKINNTRWCTDIDLLIHVKYQSAKIQGNL